MKNRNKAWKKHQFIFIERPIDTVWAEIVRWASAPWWPKRSSVRVVGGVQGDGAVGTSYSLKGKGLFLPSWQVDVIGLEEKRMVEKRFVSGFFTGTEKITVEEYSNGTRVDYFLLPVIESSIKKVLWAVFYKRMYANSINCILKALNIYLLAQQKEQEEKQYE